VFIVSASGGQKPQFWSNFDIWDSCTDPLLAIRAKFGALEQPMVYAYVPNFVSIGLFCRLLAAKNFKF